MPETTPLTLLFVCTHNRCRSILCEALARQLGGARITALSAGSAPSGVVHPDTLAHLEARDVDIQPLRSQSWDDFEDTPLDAVITVCDSAAGEPCPLFLRDTVTAHWGLPDPSKVQAPAERAIAFDAVIATIEGRLRRLLTHDFSQLKGDSLRDTLEQIAETID